MFTDSNIILWHEEEEEKKSKKKKAYFQIAVKGILPDVE